MDDLKIGETTKRLESVNITGFAIKSYGKSVGAF
jgi:hypothetical protein